MMTSRAHSILLVVINCARNYKTFPNKAGNEKCKDDTKTVKMQSRMILTELDVSGASINGRNPNQLKNDELKRLLRCRGANLSGTRTKLLER